MKRLILLLTTAVMSTGLTSCYKTWDCACIIKTTTDGDPIPVVDYVHVDVVGFKGEAKKQCDAGDDRQDYGIVLSETECDLNN